MESVVLLLGRLLNLADYLHENYCIIERNDETPENYFKPIPKQLMEPRTFILRFKDLLRLWRDYL
ncbi:MULTISPECIES: hypothetical protein [Hungatella]|uniref:hypothetical protein n=1 Tax=Hungatella TaxID=1649459 RepID=UPI0011DCCF5E|nr:hypothetical protein [Hungatella hathewayi]